MATVTPTFTYGKTQDGTKVRFVTWSGIVTGDTCTDAEVTGVLDTIHIFGTFNGGTSVAIQGSNEQTITSRIAMKDVDGATIAALAAALVVPRENPHQIRPAVTAGAADSVTVVARTRF